MNTQVRLIGMRIDLGAGRRGVDMGPSALRVADLEPRLRALGVAVEDSGDINPSILETSSIGDPRLKYCDVISTISRELASQVKQSLTDGKMPVVLGGDHSLAVGSVAGSSSFYRDRGERLGLIWFDAHGDFNTPETTPSGNIHGMSFAICCGVGAPELTGLMGFSPKVSPAECVLIAARDLDPGERENLRAAGVTVYTMRHVDELGMKRVMELAMERAASGTAGIHLSFDLDALDPHDAPGTGTPVRGGVSYREAHLAMEMMSDSGKIRAMDLVEINPVLDEHNRTAALGVELICSAMGKGIY